MLLRIGQSIKKLGKDIAIARRKRRFSQQRLADGAGVGVSTVRRLEAGDAGISLANLAMILLTLGEIDRIANLIDMGKDDVGLLMELDSLPKMIRKKKVSTNHIIKADDGFDASDL